MIRVEHRLDVPWADTDAAQIVWFGNFARYVEAAETVLFSTLGGPLRDLLAEHHILTPRTHMTFSFRSPARFADRLRVALEVTHVTERRVAFAFEITHDATGRVVSQGAYRIACVDASTFEPRPFPAAVIALLTDGTSKPPVTSHT